RCTCIRENAARKRAVTPGRISCPRIMTLYDASPAPLDSLYRFATLEVLNVGRIFRMSALFIFLKVYIFLQTYKVSEITSGKLPDFPCRTRAPGKDNHFFAVPAQVFQNRQEIAVTRQDNDAIKILLFFHEIESHF